jgi:hypothetical protein
VAVRGEEGEKTKQKKRGVSPARHAENVAREATPRARTRVAPTTAEMCRR